MCVQSDAALEAQKEKDLLRRLKTGDSRTDKLKVCVDLSCVLTCMHSSMHSLIQSVNLFLASVHCCVWANKHVLVFGAATR